MCARVSKRGCKPCAECQGGVRGARRCGTAAARPPNTFAERFVGALGEVLMRWFPWGNRGGGGGVEDAYRAKLEALERVYRRSLKPKA